VGDFSVAQTVLLTGFVAESYFFKLPVNGKMTDAHIVEHNMYSFAQS